jgi:hypothetical protein
MNGRMNIAYVLCTLCLILNAGCGGFGSSRSETGGSNDGSSITLPINYDFAVDGGVQKAITTTRTAASAYTQAITPQGGTPPYTMKITSLSRGGREILISTKLKVENGELSWSLDPTYFGDYLIEVEVTDSEGKKGLGIASVKVELPAGLPAVATGTDAVLTRIKALWEAGQLAGNLNDWYANRDARHAPADAIAQALTQVQLEPAIRAPGVDFQPIPNKVLIGNASLAYTTGEAWGSLPRVEISSSPAYYFDQLYKVSRGNNLFWYPEHRDHDEADYFHFNQWFLGISQGSSTTELDEVHHDFYALASFRPEVKTALTERGLLMNVLQMVRRRARVASDDLYLSGAAHTTVFDNVADAVAYRSGLVDYVNGITADRIPAIAELEVVSENFMGGNSREQYYTGPWLVSRIYRG